MSPVPTAPTAPLARALVRLLRRGVLTAAAVVATALVLALILAAVFLGPGDPRVTDREIAEPRARAELAEQLPPSFGVGLPADARLVRARLRRGVAASAWWFLVQLPPGQGAAFEADLRTHAADRDRGRVEVPADRPGPGDHDDWAEFPPLGARIWRTADNRHELMVLGDRFYFVRVFL